MKRLLLLLFLLATPAYASSSIVLLNTSNISSLQENILFFESSGASIHHIYPPNILIGENISANLTSQNTLLITSSYINSSLFPNNSQLVIDSWNINVPSLSPISSSPSPYIFAPTIYNDNFKIKLSLPANVTNTPDQSRIYGASFYDTSEYFIGSVAVGIILPESNGSIDPDTLNWTSSQEAEVISEIRSGLDWWISKEPNAHLTFTYDIHASVPTSSIFMVNRFNELSKLHKRFRYLLQHPRLR
jgi:hypothetical protein